VVFVLFVVLTICAVRRFGRAAALSS